MGKTSTKAILCVRSGKEVGRSYVIRPGQRFKLGRSGKDGVVIKLPDAEVSRVHAVLELRADGLYVTDLGSRNGTYMDLLRIEANVPSNVPTGQLLRFGSHELLVELVGFDPQTMAQTRLHRLEDLPLLPADEFEILEEIGHGSMGRVWAARQKLLDRSVAIKVLRADLGAEARERFLAEGRIWCQIRSPYVVELYDIRTPKNTPCLIMELIHGPSARDLIRESALQIPHALRIGEDTARALSALAELGVVHRDVKPHNILLAPEGVAKLGDFGIAKSSGATSDEHPLAVGTLSYVAPEQIVDVRSADARSDVFGLGATLYHLICGRPPVLCSGNADVLRALREIAHERPPAVCSIRSDCPPDVEDLVHRMLEKDPAKRPGPAIEIADRLAELREAHYPDYGHDDEEG